MDEVGLLYNSYVDIFNEYSENMGLNIKVKLILMTRSNSTDSLVNNGAMFESLLKKKNSKYDIFFYDGTFSHNYGPYLLNLNELLPKVHIDMYNKKILSQIGIYKDKIVGLPITLSYNGLYSNKVLLDKYGKDIPKTWQELMDTSKYILERETNNTDLIAYNGLFTDNEQGAESLYEFFYSCRDTIDSPLPELTSKATIKAAKFLKKMQMEITKENEFSRGYDYTFLKLLDGNAIFLKFFVSLIETVGENSPYVLSLLPGMNEGVSSTLLVAFNIGIPKSIDENKIKPVTEVVRYMTSLEVQKQLVLKRIIVSGITYLYEEEEVCNTIQYCEVYKNAQYIIKPVNLTNNYYEFTEKFIGYFNSYLFGNEFLEIVLKLMDDITRVYKITVNTKESTLGLVSLIVYIVFSIIEIVSLIFIKKSKWKNFFKCLSEVFWALIVVGVIMLSSIIFTKIGDITIFKCHLIVILLTFGYTLIYIPMVIRLIVTFPDQNKFSNWLTQNKYLFLTVALSLDAFLNALTFLQPYTVEKMVITNGENYEVCKMSGGFLKFIISMEGIYKFIVAMALFVLIFVEWNIRETFYDVKICLTCLYMNGIIVAIFIIFSYFRLLNYKVYYGIHICLIFIISLSNYAMMIGIRLILPFFVDFMDEDYMKRDTETMNTTMSKSSFEYSSQKSNEETNSRVINKNIYSRLIDYHYRTVSIPYNQTLSSKSSNIVSNT